MAVPAEITPGLAAALLPSLMPGSWARDRLCSMLGRHELFTCLATHMSAPQSSQQPRKRGELGGRGGGEEEEEEEEKGQQQHVEAEARRRKESRWKDLEGG